MLEGEENRAADLVQKRRTLLEQGVIAKRELEESERALAEARSKVAGTRKSIGESEQLLTEAIAAEQLAKLPVGEPLNPYSSNVILIRYAGTSRWALTDAAKVDAFFRATFGRPLPVSAFGQTATHNQLGFDHREAIDVALHPDSAEGRAVMDYLRAQGDPVHRLSRPAGRLRDRRAYSYRATFAPHQQFDVTQLISLCRASAAHDSSRRGH